MLSALSKDTIDIILKSMHPFKIKLEALKILSTDKSLSKYEKRHVIYVIRYAERILQEIYSPECPSMIAMKECYSIHEEGLNPYEASIKESNATDYYSSYQEFLNQYRDYPPKNDEELPVYEIDLVYLGKAWGNNNPISFSATWFSSEDSELSLEEIEKMEEKYAG